MAKMPHPTSVRFYAVSGADHFSTLAPLTRLIAQKILTDKGETTNIDFTERELADAMKR